MSVYAEIYHWRQRTLNATCVHWSEGVQFKLNSINQSLRKKCLKQSVIRKLLFDTFFGSKQAEAKDALIYDRKLSLLPLEMAIIFVD